MTQISKEEIISLIDLTTLRGNESEEELMDLGILAEKYGVASVCVYPKFANFMRSNFPKTKITLVGEGFPINDVTLQSSDLEGVSSKTANEIDVVLDFKKWEEAQVIYDDLELNFKHEPYFPILGNIIKDHQRNGFKVKTILEVCRFSPEHLKDVSFAAIHIGSDFLKTSTGKDRHGATLESVKIMCEAIKASGRGVGIKPSGGISTESEAREYLNLVVSILGREWIVPERFRFGASSLLKDLIR